MGAIEFKQVSFAYPQKAALHAVSFAIEKGGFCALLGPNGAGKSTIFALLSRLITPDEGSVWIDQADINKTPRTDAAKIGVVFQQLSLDMNLTVAQNLYYSGALCGFSRAFSKQRMMELLNWFNMAERKDEKVRNLNGGHQRRVEIVRALLNDPSILLLDEPSQGLDIKARHGLLQRIHDYNRAHGVTIFWTTHLHDELSPDDHVILLENGQVQAYNTYAALSNNPLYQRFFNPTS